eukprot:TRINITY_DN354_c0_g1_i1.p1 TRINITY_DN354_c0_g1~~TRINITY_DN354_c0_g1_i1.p1  ORF type:complete len:196 (+),score=12.94 TRINITY_DN354_c0_g1_i1:55-642(+)
MASTPILSPPSATPKPSKIKFKIKTTSKLTPTNFTSKFRTRPVTTLNVSSQTDPSTALETPPKPTQEQVFFDGGAHYGDLAANLLLGFTLLWLPLTLAAVFRAFFLRYRFTNLRVTVISGLTGQDRSDFGYNVVKEVQVVPRFIGEWGDIVITLKDGTKVDLRSVPKFREIAGYCTKMADLSRDLKEKEIGPKGF